MVHLLPHWNWKKGETVRVMAVSNCDEVELFLNGKSLGRKANDVCTNTPEWQVEFVAGRISAKAYRKGRCVAKTEQRTAGKPYAVSLTLDKTQIKNDGQDTVVLNACVIDKKGVVVPYANNLINFEVTGDGFVRGVGNGNPNSHESDVEPCREAYFGWCQALISSKLGAENISIKVSAEGLLEQTVELDVVKVEPPVLLKPADIYSLDGFTMSDVTDYRPDPLVKLADNDMNSFIPVELVNHCHQKDFHDGWRIYRVQPKIGKRNTCCIRLSYARFHYAEFYVNGKLLDTKDEHVNGEYISPFFTVEPNTVADIRILMRTENENPRYGAGLAGIAEIYEK
jgi:beta-galactosidase